MAGNKELTGALGKIKQSIFTGSGQGTEGALKFAGIGAGIGGVGGAFTTDDSAGSGFLRGAALGAGVGGGINLASKGVEGNLVKNKVKDYFSANRLAEYQETIDKDILPGLQGTKAFLEGQKQHALNVKNGAKDMSNLTSEEGIAKLLGDPSLMHLMAGDMSGTINSEMTGLFTKDSVKRMQQDIIDVTNQEHLKGNNWEKTKLKTAIGTKLGFDSAVSHIINPTKEAFGKIFDGKIGDVTGMEWAAVGMSAYGAYDAYNILKESSDGNWGSAAWSSTVLAGSKLAFSAGIEGWRGHKYLQTHGLTYHDLYKANKVRKQMMPHYEKLQAAIENAKIPDGLRGFMNASTEEKSAIIQQVTGKDPTPFLAQMEQHAATLAENIQAHKNAHGGTPNGTNVKTGNHVHAEPDPLDGAAPTMTKKEQAAANKTAKNQKKQGKKPKAADSNPYDTAAPMGNAPQPSSALTGSADQGRGNGKMNPATGMYEHKGDVKGYDASTGKIVPSEFPNEYESPEWKEMSRATDDAQTAHRKEYNATMPIVPHGSPQYEKLEQQYAKDKEEPWTTHSRYSPFFKDRHDVGSASHELWRSDEQKHLAEEAAAQYAAKQAAK